MATTDRLPLALVLLRLGVFLVMLAACIALFLLRDQDTLFTLGGAPPVR